jgi:hypothetical protein
MPQDSLLFAAVIGLAAYLFYDMSNKKPGGAGSSDTDDDPGERRRLQRYKNETLAIPPAEHKPAATARTPEPVVAPQPAQGNPPVPTIPVQESTQRPMSPLRERGRREWPDFE